MTIAEDQLVGLRVSDGESVWQTGSSPEPWGFQPPTLGAQRAYVTGPNCLFGVDLETGEEIWHPKVCHGSNTASGTIADGRLYLEYGGYFSALDATGRIRWAAASDAQGSPAVEDDIAYVATVFTATAVDLTARAIEWPWEDPDDDAPAYASREAATIWSVPPESRITGPRVHYSPALADETVYVVSEYPDYPGGELWALARETGDERWSIASPPNPNIGEEPRDAPDPVGRPAAPVVTGDLVIVALGDRHVRALTPEGEFEWTTELDHEVTDLAGAGDTLVATTHDRSVETTAPDHARLVAFDLSSGEQLWAMSFDDHVEGLALANETIYTTVVTERDENLDVMGKRLVAFE